MSSFGFGTGIGLGFGGRGIVCVVVVAIFFLGGDANRKSSNSTFRLCGIHPLMPVNLNCI
jgi:hypothetical protein